MFFCSFAFTQKGRQKRNTWSKEGELPINNIRKVGKYIPKRPNVIGFLVVLVLHAMGHFTIRGTAYASS